MSAQVPADMVGSNVWQPRYIRRAELGDVRGWTVGFRLLVAALA
jgi:hypothetical protein